MLFICFFCWFFLPTARYRHCTMIAEYNNWIWMLLLSEVSDFTSPKINSLYGIQNKKKLICLSECWLSKDHSFKKTVTSSPLNVIMHKCITRIIQLSWKTIWWRLLRWADQSAMTMKDLDENYITYRIITRHFF